MSALRNENLFNVVSTTTGVPFTSPANFNCIGQSLSLSSQSRSITPGSSPTRYSEADIRLPVGVGGNLIRSRSLDDVHRSVTVSTCGRTDVDSANQSDIGQWDCNDDQTDHVTETITSMTGVVGWGGNNILSGNHNWFNSRQHP